MFSLEELLAALWVLAAVLAIAAPGCSQPEGDIPAPPLSQERLDALVRAIGADKEISGGFHRALLESLPYVGDHPPLAKAILERSLSERLGSVNEVLTIVALGSARGESAQEILRSYPKASAEKREVLRLVFCRMGKGAASAAPLLSEELANPKATPKEKIGIQVALAATGQATDKELAEVESAVTEGGELGCEVLRVMYACGECPWATEKLKTAIAHALSAPSANPTHPVERLRRNAAIAAGTLRSQPGAEVRDALREALATALKNPEQGLHLLAGLSLMKVDPAGRPETVRTLLKQGDLLSGGDAAMYVRCMLAGIRDAGFIDDVAPLLEEQDPGLAAGAAVILDALGPASRSALPRLRWLAASAKAEVVRERAAQALGMVAGPSDVPEIEQLSGRLTSSKDEDVKAALDESLKAIRLKD